MVAAAQKLARSDPKAALRLIDQAVAAAGPDPGPALAARAAEARGVCHYWRGDFRAARDQLDAACSWYASAADHRGLATCHGYLAYIEVDVGDSAHGLKDALTALELAEKSGDEAAVAEALNFLGSVYRRAGLPAQGLERLRRGLELARAIGDRVLELRCLGNMALACSDLDQKEEAISRFREVLALAASLGEVRDLFKTNAYLASLYSSLGRPGEAKAFFATARTYADRVPEVPELFDLLVNEGKNLTFLGEIEPARRDLDQALEIARRHRMPSGEATVLVELAALVAAHPSHARPGEEARGILAEALAKAEQGNQQTTLLAVHRALAEACKREGRWEEAVGHYERADHLLRERFTAEAERTFSRLRVLYNVEGLQREAELERQRSVLERKLLETQRLESLGVLAGGIAHDFNNLLTVILGHANLLAAGALSPSTARESAQAIENAARSATRLCGQMLDYAGYVRLHPAEVDLAALLRETVDLLSPSFDGRHQLKLGVEEGLPAVEGDRSQLQQVAINLVRNAAESMEPNGGSIEITLSRMRPDAKFLAACIGDPGPAAGEATFLCLAVRDEGAGMTNETKSRAFEPFFTTKFAGRGLGLSSALGIVRAHGGLLHVETGPGKGSTFRALFPLRAEAGR